VSRLIGEAEDFLWLLSCRYLTLDVTTWIWSCYADLAPSMSEYRECILFLSFDRVNLDKKLSLLGCYSVINFIIFR
jgi:hypothetical protein